MRSENIEKLVFKRLYGKPCWNVRRGWGSFITLEFGEPRLEIGKVIKPSSKAKYRPRRSIFLHGEWHLWIYCCGWRICAGSERLTGWTSSAERKDKALRFLDGQILTEIHIDAKKAETIFRFDLDGLLYTFPYNKKAEEMWLLYDHTNSQSGRVFTFRSDGKYSYSPANLTSKEETWENY